MAIWGVNSLLSFSADSLELASAGVKNNSATVAMTNVIVRFDFGTALEFDPSSPLPPQGTYDPLTGEWDVGTLIPGIELLWDMVVKVLDSNLRPIVVSYEVFADQTDQVPENDISSRSFDTVITCEDFSGCATINELHGAVVYVATSGSNVTGERGSEHLVFRDPWYAATQMLEGDTMYVYPGTYTISDIGLGGDKEFDGTTNSMNLIPPGLTDIQFHFETGVTILSSVNGIPALEAPILFFDRGMNITCTVSGNLVFQSNERGNMLGMFTGTNTRVSIQLSTVLYFNNLGDTTPGNNGIIFDLIEGSYTFIKIGTIVGAISQIVRPRLSSPQSIFKVEISQALINEEFIDTAGQSLIRINGTGVTLAGAINITLTDVNISVDNLLSALNTGAISVLDFEDTTSSDSLQLSLTVPNYSDNIEWTNQDTTGMILGTSIIKFSDMPNTMLDTDINVTFGNVLTGSGFFDFVGFRNSMISSTINLKLGNVQLSQLGMLAQINTPHTITTLDRSMIRLDFGSAIRTLIGALVPIPLIGFSTPGAVVRTFSKCFISGRFMSPEFAVINFNDASLTETYLFQDCYFGVDIASLVATTDIGNNVNMVIMGCSTNTLVESGAVIERAEPIKRDNFIL